MEDTKVVEIDAILNGKNRIILEGYVTGLKYYPEKQKLFFNLGHISLDKKGEYYPMYIAVFFFKRGAEELSKRVREGMYVEVEGKLRKENAGFILVGTHITGAEQIRKKISLKIPKDEVTQ